MDAESKTTPLPVVPRGLHALTTQASGVATARAPGRQRRSDVHRTRWLGKLASAAAFLFFFVVNPAWVAGCMSEDDDGFTFGEGDMLALLQDLEGMTLSYDDAGDVYEVHLDLSQGPGEAQALHRGGGTVPVLATAHACGSRNFHAGASACDSTTEMPVVGTMRIELDGATVRSGEVKGQLFVSGNHLTHAQLDVAYLDGSTPVALFSDDGMTFRVEDLDTAALGVQP